MRTRLIELRYRIDGFLRRGWKGYALGYLDALITLGLLWFLTR